MEKIDLKDIVRRSIELKNVIIQSFDSELNPIDVKKDPIKPYIGSEQVKCIIIGQDPTIRNIKLRDKIECTLNLNRNGALKTYLNKIIDLRNVYATNLFKYFYTLPPSDTFEVLKCHFEINYNLLSYEMSYFPNVPVILLGENVLKLITRDRNKKLRVYWDYPDGNNFSYFNDVNSKRKYFPFPHLPSLRKEFYINTFEKYVDFFKKTTGL